MMKRKKSRKALLLLVVIIIAGVLLFLESQKGPVLSTNSQNEGIELASLEGSLHPLPPTGDKPTIVNFFATWCPPCREEMPLFQALHQEGDVHIVAINLQEENDVVSAWVNDMELTFPILLDPQSQAKESYGIFTQPVTLFFSPDGSLKEKKFGAITQKELEEKVSRLLSEDVTIVTESEDLDIQVTDGLKHLIPLDKILSGGPGKDGIPSIDEPVFQSSEEARAWLGEEDIVFGLDYAGVQRAYPQNILNWHEIVNDHVNGLPVVVTFCPLCGTAMAFDPTIDGEAVEFGVSGKLYNSDLLMYDRKTDSYWNQVSGRAVVGELTGLRLQQLPLHTVKWKDWLAEHPNTEVLSRQTGFFRDYDRYPYGDYETSSRIIFPVDHEDARLHKKEVVFGIEIDGKYKAYPQKDLVDRVEDTFAGRDLIITNNKGIAQFSDAKSGEVFVHTRAFWFAWVAHYPETELYEP